MLLELPALIIGVILAKYGQGQVRWGRLLHEVIFGKSILLLSGGLIIGYIAGPTGIKPLDSLFFDLFKGMLALFLLEMGLVAPLRNQVGRGSVRDRCSSRTPWDHRQAKKVETAASSASRMSGSSVSGRTRAIWQASAAEIPCAIKAPA